MASTTIMHGRREGQKREYGDAQLSIVPEGFTQRDVAVLQPSDWNRIQNSLSGYNKEEARLRALHEEREALHNLSKETVKNWDNTIEGQRLKKLQARRIREEKEEEEKVKIDIEEAKLQAKKRKEAIERAKTQQYYQTDRVKTFHGALLLTEVMKEREVQVKMKNSQVNSEKIRDEHMLRLQRRQLEEAIRQDQKNALKRYNDRRDLAAFQLLQIADHIEESHLAKKAELQEGQNVKQQVAMYEAAKAAIEEQKRKEKAALMESHKVHLANKQVLLKQEQQRQEEEDEEIRQFANAKKKMSKMRKEKELELFNTFQENAERMRKKLHDQMVQKVDNEDERIAKALAEREAKREADEQEKTEKIMKDLKSIHEHRQNRMKELQRKKNLETKSNKEILRKRIESDKLYHAKQETKKLEKLQESKELKDFQAQQLSELKTRKEELRNNDLRIDRMNGKAMLDEESQFQEYAAQVIKNARDRERNPYPLIKAAREGPGGGRGPQFEGINGIRPSFLVCDGTGVQLPDYSTATVQGHHTKIYGDPAKSKRRLGFTW